MTYVITAITQAVKNPERVNLYLNNRFRIGLSKNDLIALKLVTGKEVTELEKAEIEKTALNHKLIDRAIAYVTIRPRSTGEVRDYLIYKRGVSAEEAEDVIAFLTEKGLLSDEKFAEWYIEYKSTAGANGPNKIKVELMQKKVDRKIIDEALGKIATDSNFKQDQLDKIEEFAQKVVKSIKAKDHYAFKAKLTQRLMARGFSYNDIKVVIKKLYN